MLFSFPVSADQLRENPSLYSFAEIVQKLPKMWMANPIEVTEMMKKYPDFSCWRGTDTIACQSVNNRNCAEIYISLEFSSEDDYAEFQHVSFSTTINNTEEIQKIIETFWIDDLEPAKISGAEYPEGQVTIYFSNENTMVTYAIPFTETGVWLLRADFGFIRG
jgi:hypothetical protein